MLILFYIFSAVAILSALGMLLCRHPLHSAMCLVSVMVMIAGIFALLDAHFLSAVQIIVYAGAVMVLVVFVIMLLSIEGKEREPVRLSPLILSSAVAFSFLGIVLPLLKEDFAGKKLSALQGDVVTMGEALFGKYVFPFEAASILILAAIIGAVMLGKRNKAAGEVK